MKIDLRLLFIVVVFSILLSIVVINELVLSSVIVASFAVLSIGYHVGDEKIVEFVDKVF